MALKASPKDTPAAPPALTARISALSSSSTLRRVAILVVIVLFWEAYVRIGNINPLLVPAPTAVAEAFWSGWIGGRLAGAAATTLRLLALGMLLGTAVAIVLTALALVSRFGNDLTSLFTAMINPLPSVAILPLAILWFGLNERALVFVLANAVVWPMAIALSTGFRTISPTILMAARNIGLRGWRLVKDIFLPAALPHITSGFRMGWAFGWRTIVAAELVFGVAGRGGGLGVFINEGRYFMRVPDVFAGLVTVALIGILFEWVFNRIEQGTVVKWGMKEAAR